MEGIERSNRRHATKPGGLSRVTNGALFANRDLDGRSGTARRFRDLVVAFEAALPGTPTVAQQALVRRAANLALIGEQLDDALASGEVVDVGLANKTAGSLRRTLSALGISTRAKPKPNDESLEQYCARVGPLPEPTFAEADPEPEPTQRRRVIRRRFTEDDDE